jgi:hypothetical protein
MDSTCIVILLIALVVVAAGIVFICLNPDACGLPVPPPPSQRPSDFERYMDTLRLISESELSTEHKIRAIENASAKYKERMYWRTREEVRD